MSYSVEQQHIWKKAFQARRGNHEQNSELEKYKVCLENSLNLRTLEQFLYSSVQ